MVRFTRMRHLPGRIPRGGERKKIHINVPILDSAGKFEVVVSVFANQIPSSEMTCEGHAGRS